MTRKEHMTYRDRFLPPDDRCIRIDVRPATSAQINAFIRCLIMADWNAPDSAIQLANDLALDDVKHVLFFHQARQFLRLMEENQGAPLTATGNLKRAYVAQMIEKMDWLRREVAPLLESGISKVINENDVLPLSVIHGVCEYGKLICKRRNRASVAPRGLELLADAQAGRLYRHLFITLFRNFDLSYLSSFRETPLVQDSIAVILWRLQMVAEDWLPLSQLPEEVFLTPVRDQVRAASSWPEVETTVLWGRVVRPLLWFGLLECDHGDDEWPGPRVILKFRKTPLFDRFLSFVWCLKPPRGLATD